MELIVLTDLTVINAVLSHGAIHGDISDDNTFGLRLDALPNGVEWVGVMQDKQLHGLYALVPINSITVEIHTCLLPYLRGKGALEAGELILKHLFKTYKKAISYVPECNRKAKFYALKLGFKTEGINRESFIKSGRVIDQYLVGITREEFLCQ